MIAKLITTAQSREEAISKMRRALMNLVEGIKTTIPFHRQLMDDPRYMQEIILLLLDFK
jgi:acetyl-CoA carboxylase biotin carboxylase subunit